MVSMTKRGSMRWQFYLLFLSLGAACMHAQGTGTIHGTIVDPADLPVANVHVKATLAERGLVRTAITDPQGGYVLPSLPIGTYEIDVEQQGFKTFHQGGIELTANQNARVDAKLEVGNISQSVSVTAEAPLVDSRSSTVGTLIDSRRVVEL